MVLIKVSLSVKYNLHGLTEKHLFNQHQLVLNLMWTDGGNIETMTERPQIVFVRTRLEVYGVLSGLINN